MRWFGQAKAPEVKDSRVGPLIALSHGGRPRWTPRDYQSLADNGFARNPVVYRCVRMVAEAAAAVPLVVFQEGARAGEEHPLSRLLARPNPEQSGPELFEALYGALQTAGNAYLEGVGEGRPEELWTLRPDRMAVIPGRAGWPEGYEYTVGGRATRLTRRADGWLPVMQLRLFHPTDDHYGLSPLEAAHAAIDVHNAASAWNKALLDNGARPSGAVVVGGREGAALTAEQFEALRTELDAAHAGARNAGRAMILEGGLDWKPMAFTPADMDFIAGKHAAAREIALAFGVPPQLLGIPGDATYANYREANAAFWRGTVAPLARKCAASMTVWLGDLFPGCRIEADIDQAPALSLEREALWARLGAATWLTDEERRRMAGV